MQRDHREGSTTSRVRYNDRNPSQWTVANEALQEAIVNGRRNRLQYGSGLDVLQTNLKSGAEPDLLKESRKRMFRIS